MNPIDFYLSCQRATGRTTRLVAEAARRMLAGKHVVVAGVAGGQVVDLVKAVIGQPGVKVGVATLRGRSPVLPKGVNTSYVMDGNIPKLSHVSGGKVWFVTPDRIDWERMQMVGPSFPHSVLIDHAVLEIFFGKMLQASVEFDACMVTNGGRCNG